MAQKGKKLSAAPSSDAVVALDDRKYDDAKFQAPEEDAEPQRARTATWYDAAYHSVTAMVGAGVLGLPSTFVPLGWAGGLVVLLFSFWVSWYTYKLLVYMHEMPEPSTSKSLDDAAEAGAAASSSSRWLRFDRYQDLTTYAFGPRAGRWALLPFQAAVLVGLAITYTVVGGDDLHAIVADYKGASSPPTWVFYVVFGGAQVLLSQLPEFAHLGWVSALGAVMSVGYCAIATGLAAAYRPPKGTIYTPLAEAKTPAERVVDVFGAIGTILFAYGGHNIALEIQATLPKPPTVGRMMRGVNIAFIATGSLYLAVTVSGYHALGAATGPNIILAITNGPKWVRNLARAMVVVHVLAAYQVYTHPVFDWIESAAGRAAARAGCGSLASAFCYGSWPSRIVLRTVYIAIITLAAILVPLFTDLMGLIGALAVTPTTFLLPPLLWLFVRRPRRFGLEWWVNVVLVFVTGVVGIMGSISAGWLLVVHMIERFGRHA
ncbi:lysine histidine transporter 1-like [Raphidocelis subcapitata]|uniref:Lysine histidine transporter 1-like n=1 Tax=Raphidocelis subcapitata TaxID=307507 RepID=A0A2V0P765_9CHLO|nr:lysine histidine transporter 1-like [Raphidocelis subcapitata]|eukprot:GBF95714.1 lysine histidine transporter 1-like [Raphidocelis subcapitata]